MPRNYRPRPIQTRLCEHCSIQFKTKHSRTKYCSDSCRVKAFYARQDVAKSVTPSPTNQLSFSLPNVGVVATGATLAGLLNYVANDRPAQARIISLLESIKKEQPTVDLSRLISDLEYVVAYVEAQVDADFTLGPRMSAIHQKRLSANQQAKEGKRQRALPKWSGH